uniref:Uncharacterized protein n=1 Tax=Anguilla anguilla TaxID=7936 RepID=A0A0E9U5F8_ANGAN
MMKTRFFPKAYTLCSISKSK